VEKVVDARFLEGFDLAEAAAAAVKVALWCSHPPSADFCCCLHCTRPLMTPRSGPRRRRRTRGTGVAEKKKEGERGQ
jgi:hypothetical protein